MKNKEEIREEIKEMQKCLKKESGYLASESFGYIQALKWVLEDALERIRAYLRTAVHTNNGNKFFEYVDNAYETAKDVLK